VPTIERTMTDIPYQHKQSCSWSLGRKDIWHDHPSPQTSKLSDFPAHEQRQNKRTSVHCCVNG